MSESSSNLDLTPIVAAYTSAERRANVATQLRDRFGRWVEMGRGFKFRWKRDGQAKSTTGKFVGAVPNRPNYGLIMVENDPDFGNSVLEVNMKSGEQVLAKLSADALRKAGVTKSGHDVNGNPIGDVLDKDVDEFDSIKRNDITSIDREFAAGNLNPADQAKVDKARQDAPAYESDNVVAETDATKEDLGEGYAKLQEALGTPATETPAAPETEPAPKTVDELRAELLQISGEHANETMFNNQLRRGGASEDKIKESDDALAKFRADYEAKQVEIRSAIKRDLSGLSDEELSNKINNTETKLADAILNGKRELEVSNIDGSVSNVPVARLTEEHEVAKELAGERGITLSSSPLKDELKEKLSKYDNDNKDLAKLIDNNTSGSDLLEWMRENSVAWAGDEADLDTSWAVDYPQARQRERWAKLERLRSYLNDYSGEDATAPAAKPGNNRDNTYAELAKELGVDESVLRDGAFGDGEEETKRIADAIEYFGDLIDSRGDEEKSIDGDSELYGRLVDALKLDVANGRSNSPATGAEVSEEPKTLVERVAKDEGATVETTGTPLTAGIAVGIAGRNVELADTAFFDEKLGALAIRDFIDKNIDDFEAGNKLGLWHDKDNREVTLDVSKIFDETSEQGWSDAEAFGRENNQQGIFGIKSQEYRETDGSGDRGRARKEREATRNSERGRGRVEEPVGAGEARAGEADFPGTSREQHHEESVELTEELANGSAAIAGEIGEFVGGVQSDDDEVADTKQNILDTIDSVNSAVTEKDGSAVMRGIRGLIAGVSYLRQQLDLPEEDPNYDTLDAFKTRLRALRDANKINKDVDTELTKLLESEIVPELAEMPDDIEASVLDRLKSPEKSIDTSKLNGTQADLLKSLVNGKNYAILGMADAIAAGEREKFNRNYLLASLYADRIADLGVSIEMSGEKADIFGGIDNRINNLKIIGSSIVRGEGSAQDGKREVIKSFNAMFIGKSGQAYQLQWNYDTKTLTALHVSEDGSVGKSVAFQKLTKGESSWHFDDARSNDHYDVRVGRNQRPVTTAFVNITDNTANGDGLGGIMALASQYAIEGAGRKFQHSYHLLPPGNRNSKIVNGHDPEMHHPGQIEHLLQVKGSPIGRWLKELGWAGDTSGKLPSRLITNSKRTFENFYGALGVHQSWDTEGPVWHLNNLLRDHAVMFRKGFAINPNADVPMPEIYKKFVKSKTSNINPDFDIVEVIKELGFEGGISKEEALTKLRTIRDSIRATRNTQFPDNVRGFSNEVRTEDGLGVFDHSVSVLDTHLTELIDKIDSEKFTSEDKIKRRHVNPLEEVVAVEYDPENLSGSPIKLENSKGGSVEILGNPTHIANYRTRTLERIAVRATADEFKNAIRKAVLEGNGKTVTENEISRDIIDYPELPIDNIYEVLRRKVSWDEAARFMAEVFDEETGGKNSYVRQVDDAIAKRVKLSADLEELYKAVEADIPPAPREIGGSAYQNRAVAGGSQRIYEEDINPRDITGRIAEISPVRPRAIYAQDGTELVRLDAVHTQTVPDGRWRSGDASDDSRVIARNFSTSVLKRAYANSISDGGADIELRYQDSATINVKHSAVRDALQMQGINVDDLINRSFAKAGERLSLRDYPVEVELAKEVSYGNGTRRDYDMGEGRRKVSVITYPAKDSNGTVALTVSTKADDAEAGTVFGRVVDNGNGTYSIQIAKGTPVAWPATADELAAMPTIGRVPDRDIALSILDTETRREFAADANLIKEIDGLDISGSPVIELEVPAGYRDLQERGGGDWKMVQIGLNGKKYLINTDIPGDPFGIRVRTPDGDLIAKTSRYVDPATGDFQYFTLEMGRSSGLLDGVRVGDSLVADRFTDGDEMARFLGEAMALANGADVNPITGDRVRSADTLPAASAEVTGMVPKVERTGLYSGDALIHLPRGGHVAAKLEGVPADTAADDSSVSGVIDYIRITIPEGGAFHAVGKALNGNYSASIYRSYTPGEDRVEFDSYEEARTHMQNTLRETYGITNPEALFVERKASAVEEPEAPEALEAPEASNELLDRVAKVTAEVNNEPTVIDDSYEKVSRDDAPIIRGSNPVNVYRDKDGKLWVVKRVADETYGDNFKRQLDMEIFAMAVYRAMGINAGAPRRAQVGNDDNFIMSPYIPHTADSIADYIDQVMASGDNERIDNFRAGIALDVLMNNADSYLHTANMIVGDDGNVYRIDGGGAMFYHPAGNRTPYARTIPFQEYSGAEEIIEFMERHARTRHMPNYRSITGLNDVFARDSEPMRRYVEQYVAPMSDEAITRLASILRDDVDRNRTIETLKYRRDGMLAYFGVSKPGAEPAARTATPTDVQNAQMEEAKALSMPEGYRVMRTLEDNLIQIEHIDEEEAIPHPMVRIFRNEETGKFDITGLDINLDPKLEVSVDDEAVALKQAADFLNGEGVVNAPEVAPEVLEAAPKVVEAPRILANLNQPQIVLNAVKQAFQSHKVLPNGDIMVESRDYAARARNDNRVFRYEAVLHKTRNDDFVAYVRQYQIDASGNQIGDVTVGKFTDTSHSPEVTVARVRALLQGNSVGRGINGSNPNNWFNNAGDREAEAVDPANGQPLPKRFIDGRSNFQYIGDTGIPKTGNAVTDALIQNVAGAIDVVPAGAPREQFIDNLVRNWSENANNISLSREQLKDVIDRLIANRETPGVNMIPYPARDGKTIVRVGDKVNHFWNGREKVGYVRQRTRVRYLKPNGTYSYEDVVYVEFPGTRGGWRRITTKNLEVLNRADGSKPLPVEIAPKAGGTSKAGGDSNAGEQLKWQEGSDGIAYLGGSGKTAQELANSAFGIIELMTLPDGSDMYKVSYRDSNGNMIPEFFADNQPIEYLRGILELRARLAR